MGEKLVATSVPEWLEINEQDETTKIMWLLNTHRNVPRTRVIGTMLERSVDDRAPRSFARIVQTNYLGVDYAKILSVVRVVCVHTGKNHECVSWVIIGRETRKRDTHGKSVKSANKHPDIRKIVVNMWCMQKTLCYALSINTELQFTSFDLHRTSSPGCFDFFFFFDDVAFVVAAILL